MKSLILTSLLAMLALVSAPSLVTAQTNTYPWPSSGNVGIGATAPAAKLEINAPGEGLKLTGRSGGISAGLFTGSTTDKLYIADWATGTKGIEVDLGTGNVGIGTTNPTHPLSVNGTIEATEVIVQTGWSDYVFAPTYRLAPLSELETAIKTAHHLPGIPSQTDVSAKGVSVGNMQAKLLEKIEELTLYVIAQDKRLSAQNERIEALESENHQLRTTR
jgi:hypothetical protein